jgi:hypothetical protein
MARRAPTTKPERIAAYAHYCPTCLAEPGQTCIRPRGRKHRPHVARIKATR